MCGRKLSFLPNYGEGGAALSLLSLRSCGKRRWDSAGPWGGTAPLTVPCPPRCQRDTWMQRCSLRMGRGSETSAAGRATIFSALFSGAQ